jgi:membrane protein implicated in regulation of membrane protease activity
MGPMFALPTGSSTVDFVGSPSAWQAIWVIVAAVFLVMEMRHIRLFFLPMAIGAASAALLAFAGVPVGVEWAAFMIVSIVALVALRPLAHRIGQTSAELTTGSNRWVGQEALVLEDVPAHGWGGWVQLGRERWRAASGLAAVIPAGANVIVTAVDGAHVVVLPTDPVWLHDPGTPTQEPRS